MTKMVLPFIETMVTQACNLSCRGCSNYSDLAQQMFSTFHPHPHLGSYFWAFFSNLTINNYEYYGRLFYLFLYICGLYFVLNKLIKNNIIKIVGLLILTTITYKYTYFSGLQEVLIFSLLVIVSIGIYDYIKIRKSIYFILIALTLNLILWLKAEGIVYYLIIVICFNCIESLNKSDRIKFNLLCLTFFITKILLYKYFEIIPNNQPYSLNIFKNIDLVTIFYQINNIIIYFFYNSINNMIYFITLVSLLILRKKIFDNEFYRINFIFLILNLTFIFGAYLLRDQEIMYAIKTTLHRLIFTSSGFYLLFIGLNLKKFYLDLRK